MTQQALMAASRLASPRPGPGPDSTGDAASDDRPRPWRLRGRVRLGTVFSRLRKTVHGRHRAEPTISLTGDVDAARRVMRRAAVRDPGRHSYGGVVITEAATIRKSWGSSTSPLRPRQRESVGKLIAIPRREHGALDSCAQDGSCSSTGEVRRAFAADVEAPLAEFMAQSQVPWGSTRSTAR